MRPKSVVCTQQQGLECSKTVNILLVSQKEDNLMVQNCKTERGECFVACCSIFQTNLSFQKRAAIPNPLASSLFKIAWWKFNKTFAPTNCIKGLSLMRLNMTRPRNKRWCSGRPYRRHGETTTKSWWKKSFVFFGGCLIFSVVFLFFITFCFIFMCLTFLRKGRRGKGKSETYICSRATVKTKSQSTGHAAGLGRFHSPDVSFRRVNLGFLVKVIQERMKKMKEQEDDYKKQAMNT